MLNNSRNVHVQFFQVPLNRFSSLLKALVRMHQTYQTEYNCWKSEKQKHP